VIAVNDNCSAVNQDTEPSSVAHSSNHESSEHFKGYPYAGEYKHQNAHQKGTVTTSILERNVLMERIGSQNISFQEKEM
jgi:hypothetical protein